MNKSDDYELYDKNFDEWLRRGLEAFGLEDHPGRVEQKRSDEYA
ncbi:hypothetical protein [Paenibacillus prosopidis]|uniref:Uncharacterized protein n=1 Tax=Paenibacillus prosopidis TaxID=630520 RepID=A0A368VQQ8_9BACL|nr:hypothetical protein [Paenibacillus prosopidis]RCW44240.1 hypothetical protein DFP97_112104 [Paenibacillus prosopidis]